MWSFYYTGQENFLTYAWMCKDDPYEMTGDINMFSQI